MSRIQTLSRLARRLFWLILLVSPLAVISYWSTDGALLQALHFQLYSLPLPPLHTVSSSVKFLAFLVTLIPLGLFMAMVYHASRLFRLYEHGEIFNAHCARRIRNVAVMLLIYEVTRPIYDVLISFIMTYHSGVLIHVVFDVSDLIALVLGVLLFVIGWVMLEANDLKAEQDLTV